MHEISKSFFGENVVCCIFYPAYYVLMCNAKIANAQITLQVSHKVYD